MLKQRLVNELLFLSIMLLIGTLILPAAIYAVGTFVFGAFEGGYWQFFGELMGRLVGVNGWSWFLVLAPYLAIQSVRLAFYAARRQAEPNPDES